MDRGVYPHYTLNGQTTKQKHFFYVCLPLLCFFVWNSNLWDKTFYNLFHEVELMGDVVDRDEVAGGRLLCHDAVQVSSGDNTNQDTRQISI